MNSVLDEIGLNRDELRDAIQQHPSVQSVEVATPTLEDIFVSYMKSQSVPTFTYDASGVEVSR